MSHHPSIDKHIEEQGIIFGKYHLLAKLAVGGMAELFIARQGGLAGFNKKVAIKCILPYFAQKSDFITMFLDEARVAAHLNHPNVVQIYDINEFEGIYYMAMEYIPGQNFKSFRKRLAKRPEFKEKPPYLLYAALFAQAAAGLEHVHEARDENSQPLHLVHRDISPNNLMLSYDGVVKVVDFGVAKAKSQEHETEVGVLKGRLSYMSPEHLSGQPIDHRSDLFALAVVLYEMTTGKRLFKRKNEAETIQALLTTPIPPPSRIRPDFPAPLEKLLLKALNRNPKERFQSTREMRLALEDFAESGDKYYGPTQISDLVVDLFAKEFEDEKKGKFTIPVTQNDLINLSRGSYRVIRPPETQGGSISYGSSGPHERSVSNSGVKAVPPHGSGIYTPGLHVTQPQGSPFGEPPKQQGSQSGPPVDTPGARQTSDLSAFPTDIYADTHEPTDDEDPTTATGSVTMNLGPNRPQASDFNIDIVEVSDPIAVDAEVQHAQAKPAQSRWVMLLLIFLFLGAASVSGWWFIRSKSPDLLAQQAKQKTKILELINQHQYLKADQLLEQFQKTNPDRKHQPWIDERRQHIQLGLQIDTAQKLYQQGKIAASKQTLLPLEQQHKPEKLAQRFPQYKLLRKLLTQAPTKRPPTKRPTTKRPATRRPTTKRPATRRPTTKRPTKRPVRRRIVRRRIVRRRIVRRRIVRRRRKPIPFSAIRLQRKIYLPVYKNTSRGRRYTNAHPKLCRKIEREVAKALGLSVRGVTRPWRKYVKQRFARSNRKKYVFYPRAVAYVIYRDIKRGKSKAHIGKTLVKYQRTYRFSRYRNK